MGHAERLLDGQAPNQATDSGRAGADNYERTSRIKGTRPIPKWVTPASSGYSPAEPPDPVDHHHNPRNPNPTVPERDGDAASRAAGPSHIAGSRLVGLAVSRRQRALEPLSPG